MRLLAPALRFMLHAMNILSALAAVLMAAMVVLASVMRYFVGAPLTFSDELVGLLFVAMACLAIPVALLNRRHLVVDLVVTQMPGRWRRIIDVFAALVFIVFGAAFAYNAFDFADFSRTIEARSDIGGLLLWPWMMIVPATFGIAILVALWQLVDAVRLVFGYEPTLPENRPVEGRTAAELGA